MLKSSLVIFLTGITVFLCQTFPNAANDLKTGLVMKLPDHISDYKGFSRSVSEEEKVWLPSDTEMLKRVYYPKSALNREEALNKSISVTLILSGADPRSLHRPEVCLDGQGWAIVDEKVVEIDMDGKTLKVKDLYLQRNQTQPDKSLQKIYAHYVYWWVGSEISTPETAQRAWISAKENIIHNRNTRWGYPSIMSYVDTERGEVRADSQQRIYSFIQNYGTLFLKNY